MCVYLQNDSGRVALVTAAIRWDQYSILQALLSPEGDADPLGKLYFESSGQTLLHHAAACARNRATFDAVLPACGGNDAFGAVVRSRSNGHSGDIPALVAIRAGNLDFLKFASKADVSYAARLLATDKVRVLCVS